MVIQLIQLKYVSKHFDEIDFLIYVPLKCILKCLLNSTYNKSYLINLIKYLKFQINVLNLRLMNYLNVYSILFINN